MFVAEHARIRGVISCIFRLAHLATIPSFTSLCVLFFLFPAGFAPAFAQTPTPVPILTWRYDLTHAGQNTQETALTPANVDSNAFGKLFSLPVDDRVFAQPLYVPALKMSDGLVHNVLFVATENDSVYAFDADTKGNPIWQVSLLTAAHGAGSGATPVPQTDVAPSQDIGPNIGITGTPAINSATNTMYVVTNTKESGQYYSRLHALNIITGAEQTGSPVTITASVAGTGDGSSGGQVAFSALWTNQRAALNYYNGYVYIAYSSHGDISPFHGWVFAYDASTLKQTGVLCLSPDDSGASVWGSGAGLPIDTTAGKMFIVTSNGDRNTPFESNSDYGESVIAVTLGSGTVTPSDSWTTFNYKTLNTPDWDLGSGGLLMLPDQSGTYPHLIIAAGKEGRFSVLNRDSLGGLTSGSNSTAVQDFTVSAIPQGEGFWGTAAYWNGNVYNWAGGDDGGTPNVGMAFKLNNGKLTTTPSSKTTFTSAFPNPTFAVSSNGTQNGIVWAVKADQFNSNGPAVLYAFDPDDLATVLYDSSAKSSDTAGPANKFVVPVVTNGKVYVGTRTEVDVYGLLNAQQTTAAPVITPDGGTFTASQSVTMSSTTASSSILYTLDGSTPTTASTQYTGAITISADTTIKAIATAPGYAQSSVSSATFTFSNQTPSVSISPAAGTYPGPQTVTLSDSDANAKIYYTTDGTTPSASSNLYSSPIAVAKSETIEAVAIDPAMSDSNVISAAYVIQTNPSFTLAGSAVSINAGASAAATISVTPYSGFTGNVTVACSITGASGATNLPTCTVAQPGAITGTQPVTATIAINTQASTTTGNYTMSITGTSGTLTASTTIQITILPPGTGSGTGQFALSGTAITIPSAGATGTSTITITPSGGFTGPVALSCAIATKPFEAVDPPACSVSQPPSITGTQAVTATLTLSTSPPPSTARNSLFAFGGASLAALFLFFVPCRRAYRALLGILLLGAILVGATGCASVTGQTTETTTGGTTPGEYTVTVTGTSGSAHATATVDVSIE